MAESASFLALWQMALWSIEPVKPAVSKSQFFTCILVSNIVAKQSWRKMALPRLHVADTSNPIWQKQLLVIEDLSLPQFPGLSHIDDPCAPSKCSRYVSPVVKQECVMIILSRSGSLKHHFDLMCTH